MVSDDSGPATSSSRRLGIESDILWVLGCGLLGGLMLWIWEQYQPGAQDEPLTIVDLLAFMVLGGGSAVVSVFLIFNVDRRDKPRLFALGIAGGFAFAFVLEAGLPNWLLSGDTPTAGSEGSGAPAFSADSLTRPGPLDRELAAKAAEASNPATSSEPSASDDDGLERRALLDEVFDTFIRVTDGADEAYAIDNVEALPFGEWVRLTGDEGDEQTRRIEKAIRIPPDGQRQTVVSARPAGDDLQDLMAVLFAVDDDGVLKQEAFDDDAEAGTVNPRIDALLDPGAYLLRILPFEDEDIGPIEVRVALRALPPRALDSSDTSGSDVAGEASEE